MVRELRRLLIPPERLAASGGALPLERQEAHYLGRVLRLRSGDRFAVVDGAGHLWSAVLRQADLAELEQPLAAPLEQAAAPAPHLELAVALPRRDADVLLRMVVELGIDRFTPLHAERSVGPEPLKPERGATILREALEQCERLWQPQLAAALPALALLGATPLQGLGRGLLATTRRSDTPLLLEALAKLAADPAADPEDMPAGVTVAIGPEGGWSLAEEARALEHGWQPVSLGTAILRCSTAAVTAAGLLSHWREQVAG
ncbi:MAG: 16S rRNA (uracil(1498)-N(3))-methyltransferase [Cyanobium sp. LacPavin_0818_WC50_MAG_67_9]|nr:16S rRNA (uracil(1498)-N(3))-methyltransferase [Cyanobium sp. LacPavin_0818_WC50_MAG_67_9]